MATLTKPSAPGWQRVVAHYHKVKSRHESPFSLLAQTQIFSGEKWQFDLTLPPLTEAQAGAWLTFVYGLAKADDNFSFVCTDYVPSAVSSPMSVRLIGGDCSWDINEMMFYGMAFSVEEVQ